MPSSFQHPNPISTSAMSVIRQCCLMLRAQGTAVRSAAPAARGGHVRASAVSTGAGGYRARLLGGRTVLRENEEPTATTDKTGIQVSPFPSNATSICQQH